MSLLITPYHILSPRLERNPFYVGNFKIRSQDLVVITSFLGIENSFLDCITRISFYQKYYQLLRHGKSPMKEKKLLVVGPPDSGRTSWFAPFQGMLTKTDFLFSSEKITVAIFCGTLFNKNLYHIETSQFICITNKLSGFYILWVLTEMYFGADYSYLVTMSFICSFFENWSVLRLRFKQCRFFIWNHSCYKHFVKDGSFRKLILWSLNSLPTAKYLISGTVLFSACFRKNYVIVITV